MSNSETVTLSQDQLNAFLQKAVDAATAKIRAEMQASQPAPKPSNGKSDISAKNDVLCLKAFKKAGFGLVKPRIDVLTYQKWLAQGMRPKEGEKSVKVSNLRLFHVSQCRKITAEEGLAFEQKLAEKQAKADAKVVQLNPQAS